MQRLASLSHALRPPFAPRDQRDGPVDGVDNRSPNARRYTQRPGREFEEHGAVNHGKDEYVRARSARTRSKAITQSSSAA